MVYLPDTIHKCVVGNRLSHARPPEVALQLSNSLVDTQVTRQLCVVSLSQDVISNF